MAPINIKQSLLLLVILYTNTVPIFAQPINYSEGGIISLPSADAAAFSRYADIPVNLSNGIPNITIPIHSIVEGPISSTISLSYHSSGIEMSSPSTWVGTGWALNAGGMISRTTLGIEDDFENYGYLAVADNPDFYNDNNNTAIVQGIYDSEPDIFHYNFQGRSGKFYFNNQGDVKQIEKSDLKIEPGFSSGRIDKFVIYDEQGNKYYFGEYNSRTAREISWWGQVPQSVASYSGWYLLRIESADASYWIDFNYQQYKYQYVLPFSYVRTEGLISQTGGGPTCSNTNPGTLQVPAVSENYRKVDGISIASIETSSHFETIDFVIDVASREDLEDFSTSFIAPGALDLIKVSSGEYCKIFNFHYSYFESENPGLPFNKRLKLEKVQEATCSNITPTISIPPYEFEYYGPIKANNRSLLPGRRTLQIDHWGFYNGAAENETIGNTIPQTSINGVIYGQANRESNEDFMIHGALKKVTYPTGGYSEYLFEANRVDEKVITSCGTYNPVNLLFSSACCNNTDVESYTFNNIELQSEPKFTMRLFSLAGGCPNPGGCFEAIQISARNTTDNVLIGSYQFNGVGEVTQVDLSQIGLFEPDKNYEFTLTVADGEGDFVLVLNSNCTEDDRQVGGLRVKEIKSFDPVNLLTINRQFEYLTYGNPQASSGILFNEPIYGIYGSFGNGEYIRSYYSYALNPLADYNGYHVGYTRVDEIHPTNGRIRHDFSFQKLADPENYTFPSPPLPPYFQNGELESQSYFKEGEVNSLFKRDITLTEVNSIVDIQAPAYKVQRISVGSCGKILENNYYPISTGFYRVLEEKITLDGVVEEKKYTFRSDEKHYFPTSVESTNSNNKTYRTEYLRAEDLIEDENNSDPAVIKLSQLNMVSAVLRTEQSIIESSSSPVMVDGTRTDYYLESSNNHPYPKEIFRHQATWNDDGSFNNEGWVSDGTYSSFTAGQPDGFQRRGWQLESFTWSSDRLTNRSFSDFNWDYTYYTDTRLLKKSVEPDRQPTFFVYDPLMRLEGIYSRPNEGITINESVDLNENDFRVIKKFDYKFFPDVVSNPFNYILEKTRFSQFGIIGSDLGIVEEFSYFDGLGQPIQKVKKSYSDVPDKKDVVITQSYDTRGRLQSVYEPYLDPNQSSPGTGNFVPLSQIQSSAACNVISDCVTGTIYEPSPLNRVSAVSPPNWWTTFINYTSNNTPVTIGGEVYPTNSLFVETTIDPTDSNWKTHIYKDIMGRKLLVRIENGNPSDFNDTQYLYDDKDRLTHVLPPGVTDKNSPLAFRFLYDGRDNIIRKHIPDMDARQLANWSSPWTHTYYYDQRDILTYDQDPLQATFSNGQGRWMHYQYDEYGRMTQSGFVDALPTGGDGNIQSTIMDPLIIQQYGTTSGDPIELTRIIHEDIDILGSSTVLQKDFTYDEYGRLKNTLGNTHILPLSQEDDVDYSYDYADNILKVDRQHDKIEGGTLIISEEMTYDHQGRKSAHQHTLDGQNTEHLCDLSYTIKDQLAQRDLGKVGNTYLQKIDYDYLPNGFLNSINGSGLTGSTIGLDGCNPGIPNPGGATGGLDANDLFFLQLHYDNPQPGYNSFNTGYRNGNISQLQWQVRGRELQVYNFKYDFLNRIKEGNYANGSEFDSGDFNTAYEYDKRGNITSLTRNGYHFDGTCLVNGQIDDLNYTYSSQSNRIQDVEELSTEPFDSYGVMSYDINGQGKDYQYDPNGNLIYSPSKDLSIDYNYLNLPNRIIQSDNKAMAILYDARGNKLSQSPDYGGEGERRGCEELSNITILPGIYLCRDVVVNKPLVEDADIVFVGSREIILEGGFDTGSLGTFTAFVSSVENKDYVSGIEYIDEEIDAIYHEEGRVTPKDGSWQYEYWIKDHLGNTRITFSDFNDNGVVDQSNDPALNEVLQEDHYYPFGLKMGGPWVNGDNSYRYNGKELIEDLGLNWYAYGARYYDPAIGRFTGVDPISDEFPHVSTYNYAENEPVRHIDLHGLQKALSVIQTGKNSQGQEFIVRSQTVERPSNGGYNHLYSSYVEGSGEDRNGTLEVMHNLDNGAIWSNYQPTRLEKIVSTLEGLLPGDWSGEVTGGMEFSSSDGQGGETRYSGDAEIGPNIDMILATFGITRSTNNDMKSVTDLFQYAVDYATNNFTLETNASGLVPSPDESTVTQKTADSVTVDELRKDGTHYIKEVPRKNQNE